MKSYDSIAWARAFNVRMLSIMPVSEGGCRKMLPLSYCYSKAVMASVGDRPLLALPLQHAHCLKEFSRPSNEYGSSTSSSQKSPSQILAHHCCYDGHRIRWPSSYVDHDHHKDAVYKEDVEAHSYRDVSQFRIFGNHERPLLGESLLHSVSTCHDAYCFPAIFM